MSWRPLHLIALAALGCVSTKPPQEAPQGQPDASASAAAPEEAAHAAALGRWARARGVEPDPVARGLYRRAVDMSAQGDEGGAAAIFEQLRERGEGSRYEARLRADASGAAALFGAAALVGALLLKTTHGGRDAQPAAPAGGHPAP